MSEYFPERKSSRRRAKVEWDLSKYATKAEFAKNVDLASLKSNLDKLDIDKLKNVPTI